MAIEQATEAQRFSQSIRKALSEGDSWTVRGLALEAAGRLERAEREFLALGKLADDTAAELERLRKPVDLSLPSALMSWLRAPLFEGEDAPPEHMEAFDLITRLARERDEARTLLTTCADAFCDAAQLIDGHKGDDWSNWDEQARSKITNCLSSIRALKDKGGA